MILLLFLVFITCPLILFSFVHYLISGKKRIGDKWLHLIGFVAIVVLPVSYLFEFDVHLKNDCCGESAFFSPDHRASIYVLIALCLFAYYFSAFRKRLISPIGEVLINCLLLTGIVLNIFVILQMDEWVAALLGNVPIIILFIYMLIRNYSLFLQGAPTEEDKHKNLFERAAWKILSRKPLRQVPILLVLCLPLLVVLAAALMLFGQKPDSLIRAFTDTYKYGLSQLDYMCNEVQCPGHYLCTIAANGHKSLVRPERAGVRGGERIICNRQLLISNAFEEWLEQQLPFIHRPLRRSYNLVGKFIHRYYGLFQYKWVSDLVYVLMKPLEWTFLLILYSFDRKPENRIARQYLSGEDKAYLRSVLIVKPQT